MLQLSVVSDELDPHFPASVRMAKAAGIHRLELRALASGRIPFCEPAELREVRSVCAGEGVTITAISPGLFKYARNQADFQQEMDFRLPQTLELAHTLGVTKVITFSFEKVSGDQAAARAEAAGWLAHAACVSQPAGVQLLIEPEPICRVDTGSNGAEVLALAAHPTLALNYDPANVAWATGADPSFEVAAIVDSIGHLHVKDQSARSTPALADYVLVGDGIVNYPTIFRTLRAAGYAGEVSLEPHFKNMDAATLTLIAARVQQLWSGSAT